MMIENIEPIPEPPKEMLMPIVNEMMLNKVNELVGVFNQIIEKHNEWESKEENQILLG